MARKINTKVSVIMPVYNAERHLAASIRSILSQTHKDLELIIINDGSTDKSEEVIRPFVNRDNRIKYFVQKNAGVAAARNVGLKSAEGNWIAYADSDDIATVSRIEKSLNYFYRNGNQGLVCGGGFNFSIEKGVFRLLNYVGKQKDFNMYSFQYKNYFKASAVMHNKNCLIKSGFFDESLSINEDWDLWLRISDDYPVDFIDEPFVFHRIGDISAHDKHFDKILDKCTEYIAEKRIKKLLELYSGSSDSEIAKKIFFACFNIKDESIRKAVLDRLESWRIYNTVVDLVKTAPKQAFELLEKHKEDKLIEHIIKEKTFDFPIPLEKLTNEEFNYIKGTMESFI